MAEYFSPLDYPAVRQTIFDRARKAVEDKFPMSNERFGLFVEDLGLEGQDVFSLDEQKQAILNGKTLSRPLKGVWVLKDLEGNEMNRTGRRTILNVPYLTDRGTFIRNGNEILLSYQMRLTPGVYTRRTADDIPEAHVNVRQGTGSMFKIQMDPKTSLFHLRYRNRKIPLYPLLKKMGTTDDALKQAWGDAVLKINAAKHGKIVKEDLRRETVGAFPSTIERLDEKGVIPQEELEKEFA